jgi:hypothetical protein
MYIWIIFFVSMWITQAWSVQAFQIHPELKRQQNGDKQDSVMEILVSNPDRKQTSWAIPVSSALLHQLTGNNLKSEGAASFSNLPNLL